MSHDPDKNLFPKFLELDLLMHQTLSLKDEGWVLFTICVQEFLANCMIENGTQSGMFYSR